jgi:hypothetical protein
MPDFNCQSLEQALENYNQDPYYTARKNDEFLQLLATKIHENPHGDDHFFHFVNCLDFFYSTGLKYKDRYAKKSVAEIVQNNWLSGLHLSAIKYDETIFHDKVDSLREKIKVAIGDYYSFVTKVFHQLNNNYFIWDSHIVKYLLYHGKIKNKEKTAYKTFFDTLINLKAELEWPRTNDELDIAIWTHVDQHRDDYFNNRKQTKSVLIS